MGKLSIQLVRVCPCMPDTERLLAIPPSEAALIDSKQAATISDDMTVKRVHQDIVMSQAMMATPCQLHSLQASRPRLPSASWLVRSQLKTWWLLSTRCVWGGRGGRAGGGLCV
jgi:hypothetical protein